MKENNIFDELETGFEEISDETIIIDTGINPERVTNRVMKEISGEKKRKFSKKLLIGLAAAVIGTAMLTTGAVASGSFNSTFAEWFSGEAELGLYSGGNVYTSSSDDNYSVNLLGVAGDDDEAYVAFEITRKDGKALDADTIESTDGTDFWDIDVSRPWFVQGIGGGGCSIDFIQKDSDTVQGNIMFEREGGYLKGERLTVKFIKAAEDDSEKTVNFELAVDLNYKSTTKECNMSESSVDASIGDFTVTSARASATSIRVSAESDTFNERFKSLDAAMKGTLYMKNGDTYTIEEQGFSVNNHNDGSGTYSEGTTEGIYLKDGKRIAVDPEEIEKIELDGITLCFD